MQITVLAIVHKGEHSISLHESTDTAWAELVRFVSSWTVNRTCACAENVTELYDAESRVADFFREDSSFYVIGEADMSLMIEHLSASQT